MYDTLLDLLKDSANDIVEGIGPDEYAVLPSDSFLDEVADYRAQDLGYVEYFTELQNFCGIDGLAIALNILEKHERSPDHGHDLSKSVLLDEFRKMRRHEARYQVEKLSGDLIAWYRESLAENAEAR